MSENILEIENLGKKYFISSKTHTRDSYLALRDVISDSISSIGKRVINKNDRDIISGKTEEFWALSEVSFTIRKGERLGIIGKNGSGKTTLLKILSRITEPSTGTININGRVASLLEIGTGFHPELTGRENIYLNGAILGMTRKEINKKFDEIVLFSEIEKFLDTPVKRYSSGMYLRLAFSVAAHLEPEIMLIDEVLAVGDAGFQKKCLGKMEENSSEERTILFVSHNMTAISQICDRVIWLQNGKIAGIGPTNEIINKYLNSVQVSAYEKEWEEEKAPGNESVRIRSIKISPQNNNTGNIITTDTPIQIEFLFDNRITRGELNLSFILWTLSGECVFNTASEVKELQEGTFRGICQIPGNLLNNNIYSIEIMIIKDRSFAVFKQKDILNFEVLDGERVEGWYGKWVGAVRPKLKFSLEEVNEQ
jgi:lipopolysaccharide transport system ATP-binding protein